MKEKRSVLRRGRQLFSLLWIGICFMNLTGTVFAEPERVVFPPRIERAVEMATKKHPIPAKYVFAMILVENDRFDPYLRSRTRDSGITQINDANLGDFHSAGFEDVYNVEENVEFGTMRLKWAYDKYHDWNKAYMVYNMGEGRAKKLFQKGIYETKYSRKAFSKLANQDNWVLENSALIGRRYQISRMDEMLVKHADEQIQQVSESQYISYVRFLKDGNEKKCYCGVTK